MPTGGLLYSALSETSRLFSKWNPHRIYYSGMKSDGLVNHYQYLKLQEGLQLSIIFLQNMPGFQMQINYHSWCKLACILRKANQSKTGEGSFPWINDQTDLCTLCSQIHLHELATFAWNFILLNSSADSRFTTWLILILNKNQLSFQQWYLH